MQYTTQRNENKNKTIKSKHHICIYALQSRHEHKHTNTLQMTNNSIIKIKVNTQRETNHKQIHTTGNKQNKQTIKH